MTFSVTNVLQTSRAVAVTIGVPPNVEAWAQGPNADATLSLANSANSKVVVIGSGEDGMPLILGGN